jgi:hypothetical protein
MPDVSTNQPGAAPAASSPSVASPESKPGLPRWFWHLFTAMGVIMLCAGVLVLRGELAFAARAVPATGKVIGYTQHQDSEDKTWLYAPIVQFVTATGEAQEFTSDVGTSTRLYQVGDPVGVLYNPAKPQQAKLRSGSARYFLPAILLFLALVFTPLGILGQIYINPRLSRAG